MPESISKHFLAELSPVRDQLYAGALARTKNDNALRAEEMLRKALQPVFQQYAANPTDGISLELLAQLRQEIDSIANLAAAATSSAAAVTTNGPASQSTTEEPMPAAVWARVAATVQIEAARLPRGADANFLTPDPLLTPKKRRPHVDPKEGLNFSPTSRFVLTAVITLLLGIGLTIYLTTRKPTHTNTPTATPTTPNPTAAQ